LSAVGLFVGQELAFGLLLLPGIAILTISGASAIALALR
jgi:hypothetical protein